jgi:hypothetical protein
MEMRLSYVSHIEFHVGHACDYDAVKRDRSYRRIIAQPNKRHSAEIICKRFSTHQIFSQKVYPCIVSGIQNAILCKLYELVSSISTVPTTGGKHGIIRSDLKAYFPLRPSPHSHTA